MRKIIFILVTIYAFSTNAQKVSQEQIHREQEAAKRKLDAIQDFYNTDFSNEQLPWYLREYNEELGTKYNISNAEFLELQDFLDSRKAAQLPFSYKDLSNDQNMEIPYRQSISKKAYPYYGKLTIKLKDSRGNEFDSYGYIYDTEKNFDGVDDYVYRDFKATVQPTSTTNIYDVYCDGQKILSKSYTTTQRNITNYESKMEGMGLLGALLQTFAVAYIENLEIKGFEGELYKVTQQKACFYEEDLSKKTKASSESFLKEAQTAFEKANYMEAIRKIDASVWANDNIEAVELRAKIFDRFSYLTEALKDYLVVVQAAKLNQNKAKLSELYKKIAILLSIIRQPTNINFEGKAMIIFPESAIDYLKKAAENGDIESQKLLDEKDESIILTKIKDLK